ncbi:MAG: hypothetical protein R3E12_09975 [Candidatus Eisenbacteria bacterium]
MSSHGAHEADTTLERTGPNPSSRPIAEEPPGAQRIGDILVEEGILQPDELAKLLDVQSTQEAHRRRPLGRIAIEFGFLTDRQLRAIIDQHGKRIRLGDLLVSRELITPQELDRALETQAEEGGLLGEILVRNGAVDEFQLTEVLADQCDLPYVPLEPEEDEIKLSTMINLGYAVRHGVVPVSRIGRVLTVALWHPSAIAIHDELEQSTGYSVRLVLDRRQSIYQRIRNIYGLSEAELVRVLESERPRAEVTTTVTEPASDLADLGLGQAEARELTRVRDAGAGVLVVSGATPDQAEETYLRILRTCKQEHDRTVHGMGRIGNVRDAEDLFRDLGEHELRLGVVAVPNATMVVPKLLSWGVHPERIAQSLRGTLSVCGVRRNCSECRESYHPHRLVLAEWFGNHQPPADAGWARGTGCPTCNGTGHRGEFLVCEYWCPTVNEQEAVRKDAAPSARHLREEYLQRAPGLGVRALQAAMEGWVTLEEALKVLPAEEVRSVRRAA